MYLCLLVMLASLCLHFSQISKYWSLHLLKMLRCAQKPRHSYLKGDIAFINYSDNMIFIFCCLLIAWFG